MGIDCDSLRDAAVQREIEDRDAEITRLRAELDAVATEEWDALKAEIERLRATLKAARTWAREQKQTTTREFAAVCGVTPTQLSQWTCDTSTLGEPDFKD
jgi:septal ring factor EnvC (AmiA/AmiB activator)